ncbi:uncharacterized protein MEPE_05753 [Melanopsichium pennsylvanicum]|uniref:Large ribosomal subunit protein mL59 domain-containing protein n=1 Tax=Melanopsichium pennsylvanicum TaxID=63383 RepID=A0AAJ5C7Z0_9BASI|nr:uncharacterized protein MEPE_05753 [Melanopsichium pennsylvanicum]
MALRHTLLKAAANKNMSTYGSVLDRFLISNTSSASSSASASASRTSTASLFEPTKSTTTGCWHPPKYSLRRQAKLVREAALTGQLELLPDGPKTSRLTQRLARFQKTNAFEHTSNEYEYVPKLKASSEIGLSRPKVLGERVIKPTQRMTKHDREQAFRAAMEFARGVGPYSGRAKIFKGSRVDKHKQVRVQDVKAKLESMETTKKEWKLTQTEAKQKLKPGLPF